MRIVFMGSAPISCVSLGALMAAARHTVAGVVTQPDRPRGRDLKVAACAAKVLAESKGIPVMAPADVNRPEAVAGIRAMAPDLIVVVAYGQLLKADILTLAPRGCINVHTSLLPKYRGAAPIQRAIANGDTVTGVTIMHVDRRMDAGDIILRREVPIREDDTGGSLHDRLAQAGAELLLEAIEAMAAGTATRTPQAESDVTLAPKLGKQEGRIDWRRPARETCNRVRAFHPWPGSFCEVPGQGMLKVLRARVEPAGGPAGQVIDVTGEGPLVAAGEQSVRLLEVQPEGRKAMSGAAYLNGHAMKKGEVLS